MSDAFQSLERERDKAGCEDEGIKCVCCCVYVCVDRCAHGSVGVCAGVSVCVRVCASLCARLRLREGDRDPGGWTGTERPGGKIHTEEERKRGNGTLTVEMG